MPMLRQPFPSQLLDAPPTLNSLRQCILTGSDLLFLPGGLLFELLSVHLTTKTKHPSLFFGEINDSSVVCTFD